MWAERWENQERPESERTQRELQGAREPGLPVDTKTWKLQTDYLASL